MELLTQSAQETQDLGKKLATDLIGGKLKSRVFCLYGDLGAGKTTFVQGLAKGLEIKERILSPTFILMRQYPINNQQLAINNFYHVDLYRIKDEKNTESLGLEDLWSDPKNIIAIEWPEKIQDILPSKRVDIYFEYISDNKRRIVIKSL